jgi:hypothetical protein
MYIVDEGAFSVIKLLKVAFLHGNMNDIGPGNVFFIDNKVYSVFMKLSGFISGIFILSRHIRDSILSFEAKKNTPHKARP